MEQQDEQRYFAWRDDPMCSECTRGFTYREWDNRHECEDEVFHAECCTVCSV